MNEGIINIFVFNKFHKSLIAGFRRVLLILLPVFLVLLTLPASLAVPPTITAFTSDTNGSSEYIQVNSGTAVTFSVTAAGATSFNWYVDNRLNATHTSPFVMTMTGYHSIAVAAQNGDGNSTRQYKTIIVNQVTAVATIPPINNSLYWGFEDQLANPDLVTLVNWAPSPYTNLMGNFFYLFVWFLIFAMIWIRSDKITVPTTLGFIMGSAVIGMLPAQYQLIAQLVIVGGLFAAIYIIARDKR